jgi:hypothetical protein
MKQTLGTSSIPSETADSAEIAFETAKGICTGIGMGVVSAGAADGIYTSWREKTLRLPTGSGTFQLANSKITVAVAAVFGAISFVNAVSKGKRATPASEAATGR